jgi:hypothetical protein
MASWSAADPMLWLSFPAAMLRAAGQLPEHTHYARSGCHSASGGPKIPLCYRCSCKVSSKTLSLCTTVALGVRADFNGGVRGDVAWGTPLNPELTCVDCSEAGDAGRGCPARRAGASHVPVLLAPRTGGAVRRQDPRSSSTQPSWGLGVHVRPWPQRSGTGGRRREGQPHGERAAAPEAGARHVRGAAVQLDEPFHEREADAHAARLAV